MWRVAVLKKDGNIVSKNFNTPEEAQNYILDMATNEGVKTAYILNKKTGDKEKVEGLE